MNDKNKLEIISDSFKNNQYIPLKYSCNGDNINPPLSILNIPKETKSMALIVDDPDAPSGNWVHWILWNISPITSKIEENIIPMNSVQGLNDSNNNKYDGPCPPSGTHRYFFKLYALDFTLNLNKGSRKSDLENAIKGHILAQAELIGLYSK